MEGAITNVSEYAVNTGFPSHLLTENYPENFCKQIAYSDKQ